MTHLHELFLIEQPPIEFAKTGLKYPVWIGKVGGQHGPRIKVGNNRGDHFNKNNCFVIDINQHPKILTMDSCLIPKQDRPSILRWVKNNYDVLILLWQDAENDTGKFYDLVDKLKPL